METGISETLQLIQDVVPEAYQQVIRWGIISNLVGLIVGLCVIVATWVIVRALWRNADEDVRDLIAVSGVGITLIASPMVILIAINFLQAWLAPYAYFVEKMSR